MGKIVQVQLGEYRPVLWFDAGEIVCQRDTIVIMEYERMHLALQIQYTLTQYLQDLI